MRTTAPIMECIKLSAMQEEVTLLATDGELSIQKSIKAEIFEEGEICVTGKLFADFIGKLSDEEICITTGEKGMEIKYRDSASYMQTLPAEEFPDEPDEPEEESFPPLFSEEFPPLEAVSGSCFEAEAPFPPYGS